MKSDVKTSIVQPIVQMEKNVFDELTSEVKETVATNVDVRKLNNHGGSFGIIDLWNIRKGRRSARTQFRGVTIPNGIKS